MESLETFGESAVDEFIDNAAVEYQLKLAGDSLFTDDGCDFERIAYGDNSDYDKCKEPDFCLADNNHVRMMADTMCNEDEDDIEVECDDCEVEDVEDAVEDEDNEIDEDDYELDEDDLFFDELDDVDAASDTLTDEYIENDESNDEDLEDEAEEELDEEIKDEYEEDY